MTFMNDGISKSIILGAIDFSYEKSYIMNLWLPYVPSNELEIFIPLLLGACKFNITNICFIGL